MKKIFLSILGLVLIASAMGQNVFTVTKTTDPDPYIHPFNNDDNLCDPEMYGTLQWAINKVNNSASNSIIEFNIPGTGVRQITLNHYLPQVYSPQYEVVLDGTSQPGYDGTPLIKVDGSSHINNCFDIYKTEVTIRGFHISNFTENAIKLQLSSYSGVTDNTITNIQNTAKTQIASGIFIGGSNQVTVTGNYIGYDPAQIENNGIKHYGIFIDKSSNCQVGTSIDTTANIISNCMYGIFVHNGTQNALSGNSIFDNSRNAIYLGSGANGDIAAPVITFYTGVLTGTSVPNAQIEIFGSTGAENANELSGVAYANANGEWSVTLNTSYPYFVAIAKDPDNNTSLLSEVFESTITCPSEFTDPCNLICNSNLDCSTCEDCTRDLPTGWFNTHGSADFCDDNQGCALCNLNSGSTNGILHIWGCGNLPNEDYIFEQRGEGIFTYLTHDLEPGYTYKLSYGRSAANSTDFLGQTTLEFKLVSSAAVSDIIPISLPEDDEEYNQDPDNFILPELPVGTFYSAHSHVCSLEAWDTEEVLIDITEELAAMDALWIYAEPTSISGGKTEIYLDNISLVKVGRSGAAISEPGCVRLNESFTLSVNDPQGVSYQWSGPDGWGSTQPTVSRTANSPDVFGTYNLTITDIAGCTYTSSTDVHLNDITVTLGEDRVICPGSEVHITAESNYGLAGDSYQWSHSETWNHGYINVSPTETTTYSVTVANGFGCTATDDVVVDPSYPLPPVPEPTDGMPEWFPYHCSGDMIELSTPELGQGYEYLWFGGYGAWNWNTGDWGSDFHTVTFNAPNNNLYIDEDWLEGDIVSFIARVRNEYGCVSEADFSFHVAPLIQEDPNLYVYSNSPVCEGDEVNIQLEYAGGYSELTADTYMLFKDGGYILSTVGFVDDYPSNTLFTLWDVDASDEGHYTVKMLHTEGLGCEEEFDIDVNVFENVSFSIDNQGCYQEGGLMYLSVLPDFQDNLFYEWYHNGELVGSNNFYQVVHISPEDAGTYEVIISNGSCSQTVQTEVFVDPMPEVSVEYIDPYANNGSLGSVNIHYSPEELYGYTMNVVHSNGTVYYSAPVSSSVVLLSGLPAGEYEIVISSGNGCESTPGEFLIYGDDDDINMVCNFIPGTCRAPYNGAVSLSVFGGESPYNVNLNYSGYTQHYQLESAGEYTLSFSDFEGVQFLPIFVFSVTVSDQSGNTESNTYTPGILYAWEDYPWDESNIISNNNLQNSYSGGSYCIGQENLQTLDIEDDLIFNNCVLYTNTYGVSDESGTAWKVYKPNDLILDNTTIESGCPDNMWQGIEAEGVPGSQSTDLQSLVVMRNKSRISDAICAVRSTDGAIIQAENSEFLNNRYDLYFDQYTSPHSLTKIKDNTFKTNARLNKDGVFPTAHVYLQQCRALKFKGNLFINETPYNSKYLQYVNQRGIGISSLYASYTVTPVMGSLCTPLGNSNTFEGLFYGVKARGCYSSPVKVHRSSFTNNFRGVYMNDIASARVLFNEFVTTNEQKLFEWSGYSLNGTPDTDESYAVYLNSCETFFLEENAAEKGDAGFYVYNSGEEPSFFYRNNFGKEPPSGETYNMKAGAIAVGKNSNWDVNNEDGDGRIGLQIRCNSYDATGHAISVINGNIRKNQGASDGDNKDLAGNQFSESLVNGMDFTSQLQANGGAFDFSHFELGLYNYYQHDDSQSENNGYYRELSENISGVIPYVKEGEDFEVQTSCPSHFGMPLTDLDHVIELLSSIRDNRVEYSIQQDEYEQIVDDGNTEYMKAVAELMDDKNYTSARDILDKEGYLTDTVLTAILCNEMAPESAIVAILIENSPLPGEVLELIDKIILDQNLTDLLYSYQAGVNNRVLLEYAMGDVLQNIAESESQLLNIASNNDSVQAVTDSVVRYLVPLAAEDYRYSLKKYRLHLAKDDLVSAKAELGALQGLVKEQPDSLAAELGEFIRIEYISLAYMEQYDNRILEKEKDYLESMAEQESELYSCRAQNLLALTGNYPYYEYTPVPENISAPRRTERAGSVRDLFKPGIDVYPNPTDGILTVDYNFETLKQDGMDLLMEVLGYTLNPDCENGIVSIYSSDGQLISTTSLFDLEGQRSIDLSVYPSGIYIIELKDCYGNNNSLKITKQ